jgi:acyl-CoA dehydrogenase
MSRNLYSEEHEIFRNAFRKFVEKELTPHYEEWEEQGQFPRSAWKKMGEQGFLCPWLEEEYGGSGADFLYSVIINEELARAWNHAPVYLHADIVAPYIYHHGTEEQKKKWLPGCTTGDTLLAVGMTEPGAGSDLQAIRTTAIKDGDSYVINGQKVFITNGISADLVVLVCKTDPHAKPAHTGMSLIGVE